MKKIQFIWPIFFTNIHNVLLYTTIFTSVILFLNIYIYINYIIVNNNNNKLISETDKLLHQHRCCTSVFNTKLLCSFVKYILYIYQSFNV